jgi:hypothetical protein
LDQIKEATITIKDTLPEYSAMEGLEVKIAVTSGLAGAKKLMDQIRNGTSPYHFIEVMGCPNGCIMGGGQPRSTDPDVRQKRLKGLYTEDEGKVLRKSHENPFITALYKDYLKEPNGHKSHELLHTHYVKRGMFNEQTNEIFIADVDENIKRRAVEASTRYTIKPTTVAQSRDDLDNVRVLELEKDYRRLQTELHDALETVDIMKSLLAQHVRKPQE